MSKITIGLVHLNVADPDKMVRFYRDAIGFQEHRREGNVVYMGAGHHDLLALHHTPDFQHAAGLTGLYHFAILVPTRHDLGRVLKHFIDTQIPLQGMSDHLVSEAIYLADPEGNGIEIYRDRPSDEWVREADGSLKMATLPMDYAGVLGTLDSDDDPFPGLPAGTITGHIHLKVASIAQSVDFYSGILGMDLLFDMGSAAFLSYNGYHHHIGVNTWHGGNLPTQPVQGLSKVELHVGASLDTILANLKAVQLEVERVDHGYLVSDPSRNKLVLTA